MPLRQEDVPTKVDPHLDRLDKENPCTQHSGHTEKLRTHDEQIKDLYSKHHEILKVVGDIQNRLLGRPSWAVVFILGLLVSACCIMGTALVKEREAPRERAEMAETLKNINTFLYLLNKDKKP